MLGVIKKVLLLLFSLFYRNGKQKDLEIWEDGDGVLDNNGFPFWSDM